MLKVVLGKGEGMETVRVRDLAQVLPKGGRTVVLLVGEEEVSFLPISISIRQQATKFYCIDIRTSLLTLLTPSSISNP